MAESPEKDAKKAGSLPFSVKLAFMGLLVVAIVFLPSTVLIGTCLIPSFVAVIIDRQPQKTLWLTVGAMNLAGTIPAWMNLWQAGHQMDQALAMVSNPQTLVMAYGGAGIGWVLHYNITPIVAGGLARRSAKRLKDIEKRQKELVRKWGQDVTRLMG